MLTENEHLLINQELESETEESDDERTKIISSRGSPTRGWFQSRDILGILGFLGFANVYAMRVNLSVAIVTMVNHTAYPSSKSSNNTSDYCPMPGSTNETKIVDGPFAWDEKTQGIVLGSFFYGYVLTQIPGGRLAEIFGGKFVFGFGILITAFFTVLSPIAAKTNFSLFIVIRILDGMGEGVTFPAMHVLLARWIPPLERNKFAAFVYAGTSFGTVLSLPISGWLCTKEFMGGWPLSFYIFGSLAVIWFIFWIYCVFDTPALHPRIKAQELLYLNDSLGSQAKISSKDTIPWVEMLTCLPLWAILITQCGQSWTFYTLLTELPTYMSQIQHFNIQQDALLAAIPYLTSWWYGIANSIFADWLLKEGYISLISSYKLFNSIGSVVPSLGLIAVAWLGCQRIAIQVVLAVSGAFSGASYAGYQMNHIALSPKYAGTMFGITNAAANLCGFLAPYVVGLLIEGKETLSQWRVVFYLAAGINIGGNLFYLAFASAREQKWSKQKIVNDVN